MTSIELQGKAIEALVVLNAAIKNIRLYPPASAMVQKSIERVLPPLEAIFQTEEALTVAESEKSLLIFGEPLAEREQQKPQVTAFITTLLDFGIKSLAFKQGLTLEELESLLQILSRKPEEIKSEGGLQTVLAGSNLPHIVLDEKIYVAMDQDRQHLAGMDMAGEEIVKFIAGGKAASDQEMEKLKELARDPRWVTNVFAAGIQQLNETGKGSTAPAVARTVQNFVRTFENLTDGESKTAISKQMADSIVDQDDDTITAVLARDYQGKLGENLPDQIINRMPDEQFERIVLKLKQLATTGDSTASLAYQTLAVSDKGQKLRKNIETLEKKNLALKKQKIMRFKAGLNTLLRGDLAPLDDPNFIEGLPKTIEQLLSKGRQETAETLIERLTTGLATGSSEIQPRVIQVL